MRRSATLLGIACVSSIALVSSLGGPARGGILDYSVYAAKGVNVSGATINGGIAGTGGNFSVGNFATFTNLAGGGSLFAAGPTVSGNVTFNGDVNLGGATVSGTVNSGGNVDLDTFGKSGSITAAGSVTFNGSTITGNVTAGGSFYGVSAFGTVTGNVAAGQNAAFSGTTVDGNLTYGNSLLAPNGLTVQGTITQGPVTASPTPFIPPTLPTPTQFTSGGANITTGGSASSPLAPGSYGNVDLATFQDLYLKPGNYYFNSLTLLNDQSIHIVGLTSQNSVNVYVTGGITENGLDGFTVNGTSSTDSSVASLASNVLFETHGTFTQAGGADNFFGTIYAPDADVMLNGSVTGQVLTGGNLYSQGSVTVNYEASANPMFVPEPPALALTATGLLTVAGIAFARRRGPGLPA